MLFWRSPYKSRQNIALRCLVERQDHKNSTKSQKSSNPCFVGEPGLWADLTWAERTKCGFLYLKHPAIISMTQIWNAWVKTYKSFMRGFTALYVCIGNEWMLTDQVSKELAMAMKKNFSYQPHRHHRHHYDRQDAQVELLEWSGLMKISVVYGLK